MWATVVLVANHNKTQQSGTWWRHQMETFSTLLALCAGNSPVPVNSPHKDQLRGALMFSLICAWINARVNNREAGDLRRHRGHYDVNVMNLMHNCWGVLYHDDSMSNHHLRCWNIDLSSVGSSENCSTRYWHPGSLHTMGAADHI